MANPNALMHQDAAVAQKTHAESVDIEGQVQRTADKLHLFTDQVIPLRWNMTQAIAYSNAEEKFYAGLTMLRAEMNKIGTNTIQTAFANQAVDEQQTAVLAHIEPPIQVDSLTRLV